MCDWMYLLLSRGKFSLRGEGLRATGSVKVPITFSQVLSAFEGKFPVFVGDLVMKRLFTLHNTEISQDLAQADLVRESTQLLVRSLPWATVEGRPLEVCYHM